MIRPEAEGDEGRGPAINRKEQNFTKGYTQ